jgi:hypothetical protein
MTDLIGDSVLELAVLLDKEEYGQLKLTGLTLVRALLIHHVCATHLRRHCGARTLRGS